MSRARVSERCALMRLQACSLSKRRWQDAWVNSGSGAESGAAPDRFNVRGGG